MAKTYDLNFRIKTDAKPTRKALEMTAAEFKDFNRTVKASQTPLDRFEKDLSDLNKAFKTGKIREDQYAHGLKRIESQYAKTTTKQKKMFAGMKAGFGSGLAGMAAGFVGFHTVTKGLETVKSQMEEIDKIAKSARGIGAKTEFLSGLEFAAQRASGLAEGAATKGIEKMTRRIEEAAQGTGEAVKAFIVKKDPNLTEQDIFDHCHTMLTNYKRPKFVEFMNELPKTNVGKVLRKELRQ